MPRRPLRRELADLIRKDFAGSRLPSIRSLARRYGVAYRTAWYASQLLPPGAHGAFVERDTPPLFLGPSRRSGDAARGLAGRIAEAIRNGDFRAGVALPKFDYFVLTYHVTRKTVAVAFALLRRDNLVHKSRRKWLCGPEPQSHGSMPSTGGSDGPPVILWVLRDQYAWINTFNTAHLAPFIYTLRSETARMGILLSMRLRYAPPGGPTYLPSGLHETMLFVKRLGNRYLGAVILELSPEQEEFAEWVRALSAGGARPVVYFDSADLWPMHARDRLALHEGYFRFYHDESTAVRLALSHLADAGHCCVGFPVSERVGYDWAIRRFDTAARIAATMPGLRLVRSVHREPIWDTGGATLAVDSIATFIERITRPPGPSLAAVRSNRRRIIEQSPSMKALLDEGITALISMNDRMAYEHYWWCRTAGIHVPRRLSQISFDHMPEGDGMPITTIDFGFSRLGYLAAHAVIGDMKVPADGKGNVAAIPMVVDRGSVVAPEAR